MEPIVQRQVPGKKTAFDYSYAILCVLPWARYFTSDSFPHILRHSQAVDSLKRHAKLTTRSNNKKKYGLIWRALHEEGKHPRP